MLLLVSVWYCRMHIKNYYNEEDWDLWNLDLLEEHCVQETNENVLKYINKNQEQVKWEKPHVFEITYRIPTSIFCRWLWRKGWRQKKTKKNIEVARLLRQWKKLHATCIHPKISCIQQPIRDNPIKAMPLYCTQK